MITFRDTLKNLNLNYVMISSFAVALTKNFIHNWSRNHHILFLKLLENFFWSFLKLSKFCIKLFNFELEAVSKQMESVELISVLQNSLGDKMNELQIHGFQKLLKSLPFHSF